MSIQIPETPSAGRVKPTREHALRIAERRKAARRWRTRRLRRGIAVFSVVAFIGPFGVIYTQLAAGNDPALTNTQTAATARSGTTGSAASAAAAKDAAAANAAAAAQTTQTTSPAAVTTQQS
jgi:hypothetical protein